MPARDDYILRFIELVGKALAQALKLRKEGKVDLALIEVVRAQEGLFARPAFEFVGLPLDEQLRLLRLGESAPAAKSKLLGYAALIREAGEIYLLRDRRDLAESAFQLSLHIHLVCAVEAGAKDQTIAEAVEYLLPRVPPEQLQPPVRELLEKYASLS